MQDLLRCSWYAGRAWHIEDQLRALLNPIMFLPGKILRHTSCRRGAKFPCLIRSLQCTMSFPKRIMRPCACGIQCVPTIPCSLHSLFECVYVACIIRSEEHTSELQSQS